MQTGSFLGYYKSWAISIVGNCKDLTDQVIDHLKITEA